MSTEPTRTLCAPWITVADLPDARPKLPTKDASAEDSEAAWESICWQASELLHALSGRQFTGPCESTVRIYTPARAARRGALAGSIAGSVFGPAPFVSGLPSRDHWGGRGAVVAPLPGHPVTAIVDATLDGEPIELDLDPASGLVSRMDGRAFPVWHGAGSSELLVTYRHGVGPDIGGMLSAVTLALVLGDAAVVSGDGKLPKSLQSIARQGVTLSFLSKFEEIAKGRTGVAEVNQWLTSVSRHGFTARPSVHSPDAARVVRVVRVVRE